MLLSSLLLAGIALVGLPSQTIGPADVRLDARRSCSGDYCSLETLLTDLCADGYVRAQRSEGDRILFVKFSDKPLRDVMAAIARATRLEWVRVAGTAGDRYELRRPPKRPDSNVLDARVAVMKEQLEVLNKALLVPEQRRKSLLAQFEATGVQVSSKSPSDVRAFALLRNVDAQMAVEAMMSWTDEDWAAFIGEGVIVFSTHPRGRQHPLPGSFVDRAKAFQDSTRVFWREHGFADRSGFHGQAAPAREDAFDPGALVGTKVRYVITSGGQITVEVFALDRDNLPIVLTSPWRLFDLPKISTEPEPCCEASDPFFDKPYRLPDSLSRLGGSEREGACPAKYDRWTTDHPDDFLDPLQLYAVPALRSICERVTEPVIVALPDVVLTYPLPSASCTLRETLTTWLQPDRKDDPILQFQRRGGWLIGSSTRPNLDRRRLLLLLFDMRDSRLPSFASFSATMGVLTDEEFVLLRLLLNICLADLGFSFFDTVNARSLERFWASLSGNRRHALSSGSTVAVGSLSTKEVSYLFEIARTTPQLDLADFDWTELEPGSLDPASTLSFESFAEGDKVRIGRSITGDDHSIEPFSGDGDSGVVVPGSSWQVVLRWRVNDGMTALGIATAARAIYPRSRGSKKYPSSRLGG